MEWFFNLHGGYANFTIIPILVYMYYQNNFCMQVIKMQPQEKKKMLMISISAIVLYLKLKNKIISC